MQEWFLQKKKKKWLDGLTPHYSAGSRGLPAHSGCAPCLQSPGPWPVPPAAELAVVEGQSCGGPDQRSNTAVSTSFLPARSAHLLINPFTAWPTFLVSPPPQHVPFKPATNWDQSYTSVITPSLPDPCSWCRHPHNTCDSSQPWVETKATLLSLTPSLPDPCSWCPPPPPHTHTHTHHPPPTTFAIQSSYESRPKPHLCLVPRWWTYVVDGALDPRAN